MAMFPNLKPAKCFYWVLAFLLCTASLSVAKPSNPHTLKSSNPQILKSSPPHLLTPSPTHEGEDTIKYRGYRLDLTDFQVLKRTDDWVKIRCTIVNSGRMNVDFSKKGTEHWVQVNYDQSLFSNKLGGMRDNIRQTLYDEDFKLTAGQTLRSLELKVPVILPPKKTVPSEPVAQGFETKAGTTIDETDNSALTIGKGGEDEATPVVANLRPGIADDCPDIYFHRLQIIKQDDKWATIEYTIGNKGHGPFSIYEKGGNPEEHLVIKAFISGVPTLSRGALAAGGQVVKPVVGQTGTLLPGTIYTGQMKVDVRKKTRYMKSLILSLESDQFNAECDKTNNTDAVILD